MGGSATRSGHRRDHVSAGRGRGHDGGCGSGEPQRGVHEGPLPRSSSGRERSHARGGARDGSGPRDRAHGGVRHGSVGSADRARGNERGREREHSGQLPRSISLGRRREEGSAGLLIRGDSAPERGSAREGGPTTERGRIDSQDRGRGDREHGMHDNRAAATPRRRSGHLRSMGERGREGERAAAAIRSTSGHDRGTHGRDLRDHDSSRIVEGRGASGTSGGRGVSHVDDGRWESGGDRGSSWRQRTSGRLHNSQTPRRAHQKIEGPDAAREVHREATRIPRVANAADEGVAVGAGGVDHGKVWRAEDHLDLDTPRESGEAVSDAATSSDEEGELQPERPCAPEAPHSPGTAPLPVYSRVHSGEWRIQTCRCVVQFTAASCGRNLSTAQHSTAHAAASGWGDVTFSSTTCMKMSAVSRTCMRSYF